MVIRGNVNGSKKENSIFFLQQVKLKIPKTMLAIANPGPFSDIFISLVNLRGLELRRFYIGRWKMAICNCRTILHVFQNEGKNVLAIIDGRQPLNHAVDERITRSSPRGSGRPAPLRPPAWHS